MQFYYSISILSLLLISHGTCFNHELRNSKRRKHRRDKFIISKLESNLSKLQSGPLKNLIISFGAFQISEGNKPVIQVDYEEHGIGITNRQETKADVPCELKQSFTGFISKVVNPTSTSPEQITVTPVFTVLNPSTLSFFLTESISTLYSSINLKGYTISTFQPPNWQMNGIPCFYLSNGNVKKGICLENLKEMTNWMEAIVKYPNCKVQITNEEFDFGKMRFANRKEPFFSQFTNSFERNEDSSICSDSELSRQPKYQLQKVCGIISSRSSYSVDLEVSQMNNLEIQGLR